MKNIMLCLCILTSIAVNAQSPRLAVVPFDSPDPTAIMSPDGKGLYVFTTGRGIQILYSRNFIDWERVDRIFTEPRFPNGMPDWVSQALPRARGIWAPDVVFHNDRYYVYYSVSTVGSQRSVIGLATNKTLDKTRPDYQWEDEGIVLESHPDHTDYNAIDPAFFVDDDGKTYLFWGSYWTGLKAVEVDPKTGKPFRYAPGELKIPAGYVAVASRPDSSIEAPYVIRRGKYYYLFTSQGTTLEGSESTYRIAVGRSENPLGPYIDRNGIRKDQGGGTVIISGTDKWKGTGHNGFFRTTQEGKNKGDWLIFHAYDAQDARKGRLTQIRPLYWDESDWPVLGEILDMPLEEFDFSVKKDENVWMLTYFRQRYPTRIEIDEQGNTVEVPLPDPMLIAKLHIALSTDGRHWTPLNDNNPVWEQQMRDPCVHKGHDGIWRLLATGGGRNINREQVGPACLYVTSKDLIHWQVEDPLPLMKDIRDESGALARNIWAPEWFYDEKTGEYMLFWSSSYRDAGWKESRLWYCKTRDWKTFTPAKVLFAPPYSVIDGTLLEHQGTYYLYHKEEEFGAITGERRAIRVAISQRLEGPYNIIEGPLNEGQIVPTITEGPTIMPDPLKQGWLLLYDYCMTNRFGASYSPDLIHWTVEEDVSFPPEARHGCVSLLTPEEARILIEMY